MPWISIYHLPVKIRTNTRDEAKEIDGGDLRAAITRHLNMSSNEHLQNDVGSCSSCFEETPEMFCPACKASMERMTDECFVCTNRDCRCTVLLQNRAGNDNEDKHDTKLTHDY